MRQDIGIRPTKRIPLSTALDHEARWRREREGIRSWWLQLHAEQNGSRGMGWARRKPAFYHGRWAMGSQYDGWPDGKNAAQIEGIQKPLHRQAALVGGLPRFFVPDRLVTPAPSLEARPSSRLMEDQQGKRG